MPSDDLPATLAHVGWSSRPQALIGALDQPSDQEWLDRLCQMLSRRLRDNPESGTLISLLKAWLRGPNPFPKQLRTQIIDHACQAPTSDIGTVPTLKEFYRQCREEELCRLLRYHRNKAPFGQAVFERDDTRLSTWRVVAHQATGHGAKRRALRGGLPEEALRDPKVREGLLKPHDYGGNSSGPTTRVVARLLFYSPTPEAAHQLIQEYIEQGDNAAPSLARVVISEMAHNEELSVDALAPDDWLTIVEGALLVAHIFDDDTWKLSLSRLASEHPDPDIKNVLIRVQCSSRESLRQIGFRALAERKQDAPSQESTVTPHSSTR